MKSPRVSFNLSPLITIFSALIICLASNVHAQQLSQLINGDIRGPGSLDNTFKNLKDYPLGIDSNGVKLAAEFVGTAPDIRAATIQSDGKILIGGTFRIQQRSVRYGNDTTPITVIWRNLARLNADGTLDVTFMNDSVANLISNGVYDNSPESRPLVWGPNGPVYTITSELNSDSYQYVVAGDFSIFSHNNLGAEAPRLRYLVLDELAPDPQATPERFNDLRVRLSNETAAGIGFNAPVRKIKRISGGGIVPSLTVNGADARLALTLFQAPVGTIVRQLNPFPNPPTYHRRIGAGSEESDWLLLDDQVVDPTYYMMGDFTVALDSEIQPYIVRVTRSGVLDVEPDWLAAPTPNARVNDIALAGATNIIVGEFTELSGVAGVNRIAGIFEDGTVDPAFVTGTGFNADAHAVAYDPIADNVVVVGDFTTFKGATANRIARIDLFGTAVPGFPAGNRVNGVLNSTAANGPIRTMTLQPDGRILIAGLFTSYNGIPRGGIARLEADGSLDLSFTPKGEIGGQINAFATDFDGGPGSGSLMGRPIVVGNFINLYGTGLRGVARLLGGSFPGIWYQPAEILPENHVVSAGSNTSLSVIANDNRVLFPFPAYPIPLPVIPSQVPKEPLFYQWQLNGRNIAGANQSTLNLTNVEYDQAGTYQVLIYNSMYFIYSQTVELSVLNPFVGVIPAAGLSVQGRIDANAGLNNGLGGNISMTISRLGSVTGTITMAGGPKGKLVTYKFAGQFDGLGNLQINIPRKNLSPLVLTLDMNLLGAPTDFTFGDVDINSQISDGFNTALITAWNNRWSSTNLATDFAGTYNVGLETSALDLPDTIGLAPVTRPKVSQGYGYFTMNISASSGYARIAGVLSDGSPFTSSSIVWGDSPATLPLWIPIYKYKGALQGELNIDDAIAGNPVTANLGWTKPSGVKKSTDAFGFQDVRLTASVGSGLYSAADFAASLPLGPGNFSLDFDDGIWTPTNGGLSAPPFSQSFTVTPTSVTPVLPNPKNVGIYLNRSGGIVSGSFVDIDAFGVSRSVRYQSIILTQGGASSLRGNFVMPNTAKNTDFYVGGSVEGY